MTSGSPLFNMYFLNVEEMLIPGNQGEMVLPGKSSYPHFRGQDCLWCAESS